MANVLVLPTCDATRPRKQVRRNALKCLDPSLLVDGNGVDTVSDVQINGIAVRLTDLQDLCIPGFPVIDLWKQPILVSVRLNVGLILKKSPLVKRRLSKRFHA